MQCAVIVVMPFSAFSLTNTRNIDVLVRWNFLVVALRGRE